MYLYYKINLLLKEKMWWGNIQLDLTSYKNNYDKSLKWICDSIQMFYQLFKSFFSILFVKYKLLNQQNIKIVI